jgi:polysaccharide export outer membrane protein
VVISLASLTLCAGGALGQQPPPASAPASAAPVSDSSDHRLGPNDTIEVRVFQEPDLDAKVSLSKDGRAALPLIGEVVLEGLTTAQASAAIGDRYRKGYLKHPKVTVSIVEYAKRRFTILGPVAKPGSYFFPTGESLTLLQAVGMAGGFTRVARASKVTIRRGGPNGRTITVDAKKMAREGGTPVAIQPGDIITVSESMF